MTEIIIKLLIALAIGWLIGQLGGVCLNYLKKKTEKDDEK